MANSTAQTIEYDPANLKAVSVQIVACTYVRQTITYPYYIKLCKPLSDHPQFPDASDL
jgi:hypothetical protein